jgi:hypothetical protein
MDPQMNEQHVTISVAEHGFDAENGETWLEALLDVAGEAGPVVTQNAEDGTLTMSFTVEAEDPTGAISAAAEVFRLAADVTGLAETPIIEIRAVTYGSALLPS